MQSAFIKRRCIQDNFLYVRNLARTYHRKQRPALLLKLDITKAFDSVSWEYLIEMLDKRGFPPCWRNWITLLLSTSTSAVRLNGIPGPWIKHKKGLRQGDPLSPYLFILAIDTLQYIFHLATEEEELTRLSERSARMRLSLYADDAILFVNPIKEDVELTMSILQHFGDATGLRINVNKSTVAPIRCSSLDLDSILHSFHGERVSFPITYLGLPLTLGRLRMAHLQHVKDRAASKM